MKRAVVLPGILLLLSFQVQAPAQVVSRKTLQGHVPAVLKTLLPVGNLEASKHLDLSIGLPLRNEAELASFLQEIYDPASPEFRHYLTPEQFAERFGPTEQDYQALIAFLQARHLKVTATYPNRVLLGVNGAVSDIETALHLHLRVYSHPTEPRTFFAPDVEPSLDYAGPLADISGLDNYAYPHPNFHPVAPKPAGTKPLAGSHPGDGTYWGNDFRAAYAPGVGLTGSGQIVGLLEFDGYSGADITNYANQAGIPTVQLQNMLVDGVTGNPGYSGHADAVTEVCLDIEMVNAMAPGLSKIVVIEGNQHNSILGAMVTNSDIKQFSSSWAWNGGPSTTTDNMLKQLAAQGQSYFQASGDSDAYDNTIDQNGSLTQPTDSTNVISVGATTLTMNGNGASWSSETVWNRGGGKGSSGGTSTFYAIPLWQLGISMTANLGSSTRRNIPDVAMVGDQIFVVHDSNQMSTVGGTSCAAPLWAAFTALVNQQATASGKPTVGLMNSAIYAIGKGPNYASDFHDVITGNNFRSGSLTKFPAVAGYDLCSGWGTPNGANLITALATPDTLGLLPGTGFDANGTAGGPFSPVSQTYTLTNSGGSLLSWAVVNTSLWLTVSLPGGSLAGGATATADVNLSADANSLAPGSYGAMIAFSNVVTGVAQFRPFTLTVTTPELVQNGGFELGNLPGWTRVNNVDGFTYADNGSSLTAGIISAHSGSWFCVFGQSTANGLCSITQNLSTIAGAPYLVSFWWEDVDYGSGTVPNELLVTWNGSPIFDRANSGPFGWANVRRIVTAAGASTTLSFGGANDNAFLVLDDVSVTPVHAPVFQPASKSGNTITLNWTATAGLNYQLQYNADLTQTNWTNLGSPVNATTNTLNTSDTIGPALQRFYRILVVP